MENKEIKDFCIHLAGNRERITEYIEFCKALNIPINKNWNRNGAYYGIKNGNAICESKKWGTHLATLGEIRAHTLNRRKSYKIH